MLSGQFSLCRALAEANSSLMDASTGLPAKSDGARRVSIYEVQCNELK